MQRTYKLSELNAVARELLKKARYKTFLFYGEMGAGKTTLIKALVRVLGAEDEGTSPTFSLVNEYDSPEGPIYHFDFYRIEDENEALDMGAEEYFYRKGWVFIEWPEKIVNLLPEQAQKVDISIMDENTRMLNLS